MNNKNIRDRHKNNDIDIENGIQESLEEENDKSMNELYKRVKDISMFTSKINSSIKKSLKTLDDTEVKYSQSSDLINQTIKKLGEVLAANSSVFCFLCLFVLFIFYFLYKISG